MSEAYSGLRQISVIHLLTIREIAEHLLQITATHVRASCHQLAFDGARLFIGISALTFIQDYVESPTDTEVALRFATALCERPEAVEKLIENLESYVQQRYLGQ